MKPCKKEIRRRPRRLHGASEVPGGANGTRRNTGGARGGRRDGASGDVWKARRPEEGERGNLKRAKMQGAFVAAPHPSQTDRTQLPIAVTAGRDRQILTKPKTTTKGKNT